MRHPRSSGIHDAASIIASGSVEYLFLTRQIRQLVPVRPHVRTEPHGELIAAREVHIAACEPERPARAHTAAVRVYVMLLVARAWGYMSAAELAEAQDTARHVQTLTA